MAKQTSRLGPNNKKSGFGGGSEIGYPKTTSDPTRIQGLGVSEIDYSQRASDPTLVQGLGVVSEIGYSQEAKLSNKKSGFLGGAQK